VARSVSAYCRSIGDDVLALDRSGLDISVRDSCLEIIGAARPDAIINCAAYTDVDGAESNEELAFQANAEGPANLAFAAKEHGSKLITISTDYVFDGAIAGFYYEEDIPRPLGVYAKSKYEGELRAATEDPNSTIVRSGWIYGEGGTNFLSMIPKLLRDGKHLTAIEDCFGTPTYAADLAKRLRELAALDAAGIFHVTNAGEGSTYFGVAQEMAASLGIDPGRITPIADGNLNRPAKRPRSSKLASKRSAELGLPALPEWRDAIRRFIKG
jgi:dTDP-4-dehydrorhamnose reductase